MSLDACVSYQSRTTYTVTVYALLVSHRNIRSIQVLLCNLHCVHILLQGLWEGSQSHGERLFTTLLSSNVEKYIVTTRLIEILFQVIQSFTLSMHSQFLSRTFKSLLTCNTDKALVEIHGETLPIEVALRAVNLMGNLLRISHEVKYVSNVYVATISAARSILVCSNFENSYFLLKIFIESLLIFPR